MSLVSSAAASFVARIQSLLAPYWDNEPTSGIRRRVSVLECASPLALSTLPITPKPPESARGLAHSKTSRIFGNGSWLPRI